MRKENGGGAYKKLSPKLANAVKKKLTVIFASKCLPFAGYLCSNGCERRIRSFHPIEALFSQDWRNDITL